MQSDPDLARPVGLPCPGRRVALRLTFYGQFKRMTQSGRKSLTNDRGIIVRFFSAFRMTRTIHEILSAFISLQAGMMERPSYPLLIGRSYAPLDYFIVGDASPPDNREGDRGGAVAFSFTLLLVCQDYTYLYSTESCIP